MCTVSFIPTAFGKFIITSNRDERMARQTLPPLEEKIGSSKVTFPKDKEAGGTWIAAGNRGRICCLLNGAFEKHQRKPFYPKSRGKVVLEAYQHENINDFFQLVSLQDVESFTLIISDFSYKQRLFEFRWDEKEKHLKELETDKPHLWSSATLYNQQVRNQRENWFVDWLKNHNQYTAENIFDFHTFSHGEDPTNDVVMNRHNGLKTVSITQIEFDSAGFNMHYVDLLENQKKAITKKINRNLYA